MCNVFGRMLFVLCLSVPCLCISLSPPTSEGPGHQEGPSQSLPPCHPIPCSCLPPRPLPAGPSILCGQDVLFSLPLSQLQGQSAMAKEKTVAIPRSTVLAYLALQLVMEDDRWGTWSLEQQKQLHATLPLGGLGGGQGLRPSAGREEGEGGRFPVGLSKQPARQMLKGCAFHRGCRDSSQGGLTTQPVPCLSRGGRGWGGCDWRRGVLSN